MDLAPRLDILLSGGVLSEKNYANVIKIIGHFEKSYRIILNEENSAAFIAHLCIALERATRGETVNMMDDDVYEDVAGHPDYERACQICGDILKMHPAISEAEARYLNLHLVSMLSMMEQ